MTRFQPFVANVATCGGVGAGWVWNVKVYVADGVSTQTFTVAVNGTTVATLTGSESYGPFRVVGPDTLTVTANSASDTQVVTLDGNVMYTNPPAITDPEHGLVAPLTLPAAPGKPLTTQGGNTLDDGVGNQTIANILSLESSNQAPGALPSIYQLDGLMYVNGKDQVQIRGNFGNTDAALYVGGGASMQVIGEHNGGFPFVVDSAGLTQANQGLQVDSASQFNSGTGAPTIAGTAGDFFFRTDTPTTADQRIYICTVTGAAGAATWVGIV